MLAAEMQPKRKPTGSRVGMASGPNPTNLRLGINNLGYIHMTYVSFHNVKSIEVTETQLRDSHSSDGEHYAARDITITTDQGVTVITVFTEDSTSEAQLREALAPVFTHR